MTSRLWARQVSNNPATIHAASAAGVATAGKNSPAMPKPSSAAATASTAMTADSPRRYSRSLQRPMSGSAPASTSRTSISSVPTVASGSPSPLA